MCAGALHWSQIDELIFGAKDPSKGYSLFGSQKGKKILHPRTSVKSGIMEEQCELIIEEFFKKIRDK